MLQFQKRKHIHITSLHQAAFEMCHYRAHTVHLNGLIAGPLLILKILLLICTKNRVKYY